MIEFNVRKLEHTLDLMWKSETGFSGGEEGSGDLYKDWATEYVEKFHGKNPLFSSHFLILTVEFDSEEEFFAFRMSLDPV